MFKVGLTGGIASGKSIISQHFRQLGVSVFDTDEISHALMQPGEAAYNSTIEHFGQGILNDDLTINRRLLRQKVFNYPDQRLWLEKMIHPMIRERSRQVLQQHQSGEFVMLVVPLLFETGFEKLVDYVIAIDCPASVQKSRLMQRDGIDEQLAEQMIAAQLGNEQRLALSDISIRNRDNDDLSMAAQTLHARLVKIAQQNNRRTDQ